jgi:zinc/manganese transport system permease protein
MFDFLQLDFMVQAFIVSIIIGVVLSYLGVHVVGRGIVFVDLALGQISSLGVAYSDYIGHGQTIIPIIFALSGAILMSLIRITDKRLKLEAIIGIIYAIASAATVMLISKSPHGDSDIQEVLFGNILSITTLQIKTTAIIFGALALLHLIFHKKFFKATENFSHKTDNDSVDTKDKMKFFGLWNFIFYLSIGLAIVFSVRISGVIPVFSFLIIPAVGGIMLSRKNLGVTLFAVLISILAVFFGLDLSFHYDFPAGSSLVALLGGIFLVVSVIYFIKNSLSGKIKYGK